MLVFQFALKDKDPCLREKEKLFKNAFKEHLLFATLKNSVWIIFPQPALP